MPVAFSLCLRAENGACGSSVTSHRSDTVLLATVVGRLCRRLFVFDLRLPRPDNLLLSVVGERWDIAFSNAHLDALPEREDVTEGARLEALEGVCCNVVPLGLR